MGWFQEVGNRNYYVATEAIGMSVWQSQLGQVGLLAGQLYNVTMIRYSLV